MGMNGAHIELTGGESVYCINEAQLVQASRLASSDESGPRIRIELNRLSSSLTRNERAALAFLLIEELIGGNNGERHENDH